MNFSSAPMSNLTIYRKDYVKKFVPKSTVARNALEYANPLAGPYEEHVLPYCKYDALSPVERSKYPEPKEYSLEVWEKYPSRRNILKKEHGGILDFEAIDKLYENENRTTYMVSYCRLKDYDSKIKRERITASLPEDWIIPLTTQRCGYRDPLVISPEGITKLPLSHPKDNLVPNKKEREILKIQTGETIYISDISNTGAEIIEGKLHGDVNIRPQFNQDDLLKAKLIRQT